MRYIFCRLSYIQAFGKVPVQILSQIFLTHFNAMLPAHSHATSNWFIFP